MREGNVEGLDTNVLVFADDQSSPNHRRARLILEEALQGKRRMCVSPQVLAEFFAVITSAHRVKNPLPVVEAKKHVGFLNKTRAIKKIYPRRSVLKRCLEFCLEYDIRGVKIFDVFYAVTLLDNGVRRLITENEKDFLAFKERGLTVENPFHQDRNRR